MNEREAANRLCDDQCLGIFGCVHNEPWMWSGGKWMKDVVMQMAKDKLSVTAVGIVFRREWPWAVNPLYRYADYGLTWGFTPEEVDQGNPPAGVPAE